MKQGTAHGEHAVRLKRRLRGELRWLRARLVGHALLGLLAGPGLLLAVAAWTAPGWTRLGPVAAAVLGLTCAGAIAFVLVSELVRPLRRVANLKGFSRALEAGGGFGNLLEAATQFSSPRKQDPVRSGASPDLVEEILRRAQAAAASARLAPRVPLTGVLSHVSLAVLALGLWIGMGVTRPDRVGPTLGALVHPASLAAVTPSEGLYSLSGDRRVPVGGDVELRARDFTAGEEAVSLEINRTGDFWQVLPTELAPVSVDPSPWREAVATLRGVEDPLRYRFRKGRLLSPVHVVEVKERPVLTSLTVRVRPPAYSGLPEREIAEGGGVVSVLVGTEVRLEGVVSAELATAVRAVEGGDEIPLAVEGPRFSDRFVVESDLAFRLRFTDLEGLPNEGLTVHRFVAEPDDPPTVQITAPARDLPLERDLRLEIAGIAADDVDLDRLVLVHRTDAQSAWTRVEIWSRARGDRPLPGLQVDRGERDVAVRFVWDLGDLTLLPGDEVSYALEATDNNALAGGQTTRSQVYRLRLPTIAEVFELDREERGEDADRLGELLDEGKRLKEDMERIERELLKNPEPDWSKQQEIRDALERQAELRERLQETAERMQRQLEEFERDNAGSLELAEKMETVQELLQSLQDDEGLRAYLEAMREAMDQLQPHEIQRNMEDALGDQQEFNRRLDRTIELLKQLERERAMSDLVEELDEYRQRQEQLAELTEPDAGEEGREPTGEQEESDADSPPTGDEPSTSPSDEELARMQERLREETEALMERLEKTLEELKAEQREGEAQNPSAEEMRKSLEEALEQMQQQSPTEPMESAEGELEDGDRDEARQQQDEARRRLLSLYEVMLEGQQAMQMAQGKWAGEKLQQTAFDLLNLSFRQEGVVDLLRDGARGQQMQPVTREQSRISRATSDLVGSLEELARQDFNIPERLLGKMRDLVGLQEDAVRQLQLARAGSSRDTASEIMGGMNELVIGLLTAAKNSQGGGGQGQPMPSLSQQMQRMSEEQRRLNGMTQDLRQRMQQGLTPQERQQLGELRGRQEAIRRQLEEMRREVEDERRILGDLDDLGRSMEVVEEDLGGGRLDADTERQQERILSRLLDAQRSVRERDFAKRRESRGAEELFRPQPGDDGALEQAERESTLRRWAAPERAPDAFREDVRRYFRSIQRELDRQATDPRERR